MWPFAIKSWKTPGLHSVGGGITTNSGLDKALSQTQRRGWSPTGQVGGDHKRVRDNKICCGFLRTVPRPSGRGRYSGSLLLDLGVTSIIITGGPQGCILVYAANDTNCICDGLLTILFSYANYDPQFTFTHARRHTHTQVNRRCISSPERSDRIWGPPTHTPDRLFNWYRGYSDRAECRGEGRGNILYRNILLYRIIEIRIKKLLYRRNK